MSINNDVTTLGQLESLLWEAANILRGPVDAADFKTYVFPLLFFKRISDVHDEEYTAALAESGGDEEYAQFPQNYRFQIPEGCHWSDVRVVATNIGQALQKAMRCIEKANPETLYGIFGDAAWSNKERLPDSLLRDLIEHFSRIALGNQAAQADILGQSPLFHQAVGPLRLYRRPLGTQPLWRSAPGQRRLRLLAAHSGESCTQDRPLRHPFPARGSFPSGGSGDAAQTHRSRSD